MNTEALSILANIGNKNCSLYYAMEQGERKATWQLISWLTKYNEGHKMVI